MTLIIDAETAQNDYQQILNKMRPYTVVQGFRKGKAPLAKIEKIYGPQIKEEFYNQKIGDYYKSALDKIELNPVNQGETIHIDWEKGKELEVKFRFEVMSEIEIKQYKNLKIPFEEIKFKPEMVDATLLEFRNEMAIERDADSPTQEGDEVTVKILIPDDNDPETEKEVSRVFVLGDNIYCEDFNKNLTGRNIGDEVVTTLFSKKQKETEKQVESSLVDKEVKVMIQTIKRKELPELNDEFAKDLEYDDLADLKQKVTEGLKQKLERENETRMRNAIISVLIDLNPLELPPSMITNYAENLAKPSAQNYKIELEKIVPMYLEMAEYNLKSHYLMEEIKKLENIEVTDSDKQELIKEAAENLKIDIEKYKELYNNQIESEDFTYTAQEKKLLKLIKDNSTFVPYPKEQKQTKKTKPEEKEDK